MPGRSAGRWGRKRYGIVHLLTKGGHHITLQGFCRVKSADDGVVDYDVDEDTPNGSLILPHIDDLECVYVKRFTGRIR